MMAAWPSGIMGCGIAWSGCAQRAIREHLEMPRPPPSSTPWSMQTLWVRSLEFVDGVKIRMGFS